MTWTLKPWADLTRDELYAALTLRQRVFVVEQRCAYLDNDGHDHEALHLWHADQHGTPDAYLRLFAPGVKYAESALGRVVTAPEARRTGLGRALVARGLEALTERFGAVPVRISAQVYLERFYGEFGFAREGGDYLEDDIPHCAMVRPAR
jgi:ElaA protein